MINKANTIRLAPPVEPRFIVCQKGLLDMEFSRHDAVRDLMTARSAVHTWLYSQESK